MMGKRKRIAFIRPKAWPLANRIVDGVLQNNSLIMKWMWSTSSL